MPRITVRQIAQLKQAGQKISMLTCYDATFAKLLEAAAVEMFLVGDSLGTVIKGEETTLNVTVEEIAYHTRAVARGSKRAHIVADMPFLSYQINDDEAVKNAGFLLKAGAQSVKLEGGTTVAPLVRRLVDAGIPVVGHIGMQPQSINALGGYVIQGRDAQSQDKLFNDALALEKAGAFALVLECVFPDAAKRITGELKIPTIGIGAGANCDGQVLVIYDLLRLDASFHPKFVEHFAHGAEVVTSACQAYVQAVKTGQFPTDKHSYER